MGASDSSNKARTLIKKCHMCGFISESFIEIQKCTACNKAFMPLNYFNKVHNTQSFQFNELFSPSDELTEEDIIKGIYVLW